MRVPNASSDRDGPGLDSPAAATALDHGATGNGRVLALVSPVGAIDWLCLPRFDSPSVFARILDHERGGRFRVLHVDGEVRGAIGYVPNTNVLSTRFERGNEAWEIVDFAPRIPPRRSSRARTRSILGRRELVLRKPQFCVLSAGARAEVPTLASVLHDLDLTIVGWRAWAKSLALPPFAAEAVLRSALCLKLHAYHDTGAVIAAATTSIPEAMGTERTWDYRYCWLRDAAFVIEALRRLGHLSEGEAFIHFLRDVAEAGPLQPVYGIDGRRDLEETMLPHLAGFRGNGHVRIGNAAASTPCGSGPAETGADAGGGGGAPPQPAKTETTETSVNERSVSFDAFSPRRCRRRPVVTVIARQHG